MAVEEIDYLDYSLEGSDVEKVALALALRGSLVSATSKVMENLIKQATAGNGLVNGEVSREAGGES